MEKKDFKKTDKNLYLPPREPVFVLVPRMKFLMIDGKGNPNTSEEYQEAIESLYGLSYKLKMGGNKEIRLAGYYEYVIPPLEGLWQVEQEGFDGKQPIIKEKFKWTAMIRQPEFITREALEWAKQEVHRKKPYLDLSSVRLEEWEEGLCAQVMHLGTYDQEPETLQKLERFLQESGYVSDISEKRRHHEIYISNPNRTAPEKRKTVLRHPAAELPAKGLHK